jgi:Flp pilus assembly pilin Flp
MKLRMLRARLIANSAGVAMIEFALILPLLMFVTLGGIELTNLAVTHLKIGQVAVTTADNAARVPVKMDEADIDEIFQGARSTGAAIGLEDNGEVVLSSVQDNGQTGSNHGQMISWQRCFGKAKKPPKYGKEGKGKGDNSLKDGVGPKDRKIAAQPGTAIMFVEVTYNYTPAIFGALTGPIELRQETAFNVRERTELGISNTKGKPVKGC